MLSYSNGQIIERFKNHQEGVQFNVADDGATLLVFFKNPSASEIKQFSSGSKFEIRFLEIHGVIMITTKIGDLEWMDAPYSPHLSHNLTQLDVVKENSGLALNIILVNASTGRIEHMRLIGLSEKFTKQLFKTIKEQKDKDFDLNEYEKSINWIFSVYSTAQLVKMSSNYCKIYD